MYTRVVNHWVLGSVTAGGHTDPTRIKHIPEIYSRIKWDKVDKRFLAETVARRDAYLWQHDKALTSAMVVSALCNHILKDNF